MTRRGVFATPRCPISMTFTHWRDICCVTAPMPKMPCRNAISALCAISIRIAGRK